MAAPHPALPARAPGAPAPQSRRQSRRGRRGRPRRRWPPSVRTARGSSSRMPAARRCACGQKARAGRPGGVSCHACGRRGRGWPRRRAVRPPGASAGRAACRTRAAPPGTSWPPPGRPAGLQCGCRAKQARGTRVRLEQECRRRSRAGPAPPAGTSTRLVGVWVVLLGQLVERLLHLAVVGAPRHAQHAVKVGARRGACAQRAGGRRSAAAAALRNPGRIARSESRPACRPALTGGMEAALGQEAAGR